MKLRLLLLTAGLCALHGSMAAAADLQAGVARYRAAHEREIVAQFEALMRLRSVAADPEGLVAAAHYLEGQLAVRGFQVQQLRAPGAVAPVVFGALSVPGATRTVAFYAHYDGQPVTPSQWSSDPFTPVMRSGGSVGDPVIDWQHTALPFDPEWRLFGRGAGDDKATIAAFLAAFDALKAGHHKPAVNLKVIWEGEEEAGSDHLQAILDANRALLAADLFVIGDGPVHQTRRNQLVFGARGAMGLELTLYGPVKALHDGHYGNWVPNPAVMAANLIAQLRDDEGNILIPGFGDDVRPLTEAERAALAAMPDVAPDLKREFGIGRTEGNDSPGASIMRPSLNVRGIRTGQVGAQAANAIPVDAEVSIDFRLVPDQTPAHVRAQVERFLVDKGWTLVTEAPDTALRLKTPRLMRLAWDSGYRGLRADLSSPTARAVITAARLAAPRHDLVVTPMLGGSVPLATFDDVFHAPLVVLPIANHDDNQHAANENLRLANLWSGIDTYAALMATLHW